MGARPPLLAHMTLAQGLRWLRWRRLENQMRPASPVRCGNQPECSELADPNPASGSIWRPHERVLLCGPECYQEWYADRFG